ncbi:hypothetical protein EWM64_g4224 [Hericium alpestre]|uniref:Vesicular-fusion protein SEC18 n=1 Tax=Hericium alpestre TaxID=135208 RepID=A0A4Z0A0D3_9AGAM|nr:hypothetical protein EWM64_g4224 [Hericium alpestre]
MSGFFSRSSAPQQTPPRGGPSPYSRLPDPSQQSISSLPPRGGSRPVPPRYSDSPSYEKHSHEQPRHGGGGGGTFRVVSAPSDAYALTNCIVVNSGDFSDGEHVLVKGAFPATVRSDNTGKIERGSIGFGAMQRQWMGLSLTGDSVTVARLPSQPDPSAPAFLQDIAVEVGFLRRGHEIAEQFSADDMARVFVKAYAGVLFNVGQVFAFEYHGQNLKATVKSVALLELADEQRRGSRGGGAPQNLGIVMEKTDVTFMKDPSSAIKIKSSAKRAAPNAILAPNFKFEDMGIGGLDSEFSNIFRRAFASRVFPPGLVEKLGIQHVKGILLHGPPGTGKTLMARQIGKMLNAREPKIVNGPEILNKYVGASEENIRKLFADAEKEFKEKGDESGLHIIIFDELDAVFKQRGSTNSGTGVGDTVVNQLLSKMDGVDQLNNILIIGMTNRLDMIDEALLRPGRLEVHMEISLPDEHGRCQILNIHTAKMRTNGVMDRDVSIQELAALTKNFSGAEIGGLVKSATSFAFNRHVKVGTMAGISDDVENLRVNRNDFMNALEEVHPAFGVSEEELQQVVQNGIIHYDPIIDVNVTKDVPFEFWLISSPGTPEDWPTVCRARTGKTALAATIAQASTFPFIKLITPDNMIGFSENQKIQSISKVFADSYKSPMSVIVIDNIERLLDWTPVGPRFSNAVLQSLMVLMAKRPPKGRRLLVIATTSLRPMLTELGLSSFDSELHVPPITRLRGLEHVIEAVELFPRSKDRARAIAMLQQAGFKDGDVGENNRLSIGVKKLLSIVEMARQEPEAVAERLTKFTRASNIMSLTNYAIAGIGNVGAFVAEELLNLKQSGKVKDVVILSRSATKNKAVEKLVTQGARVATVDYSSQDALNSGSQAAGVRLFVPSEFGIPNDTPKGGPLLKKYQAHGALKDLGLPYVLVYNGAFTDFIFSPPLGLDIGSGKISYGADGNAPVSFTSRRDVTRFLAHVLTTLPLEKLQWNTLRIEGDRVSFNEIVRQYEAKTGKKLEVQLRSIEELEAALKANPQDFSSVLHLTWAQGDGVVGKPEEVSNSLWPEWNPKKVIEFIAP